MDNTPITKICRVCKVDKELKDYPNDKHPTKPGVRKYRHRCRTCTTAHNRDMKHAYYLKNMDRIKASMKVSGAKRYARMKDKKKKDLENQEPKE